MESVRGRVVLDNGFTLKIEAICSSEILGDNMILYSKRQNPAKPL
jgi:hypothetical protein